MSALPRSCVFACLLAGSVLPTAGGAEAVDFTTQVRPLLAERCLACHATAR